MKGYIVLSSSSHRPLIALPPGLQLHPKAIRQPVHEVVIRGYLANVENLVIAEPCGAQPIDVVLLHLSWVGSELGYVVQHGPLPL